MPKLTKPKTHQDFKNAKPKEKLYKIYDGDGLALCIRPSGQKVWQYQYSFNSRRYTHTIGYFETMSTKEARNKRNEIKSDLLNGIVPKQYDDNQEHIITFKYVTDEWIARQQWVDGHRKRVSNFFAGQPRQHIKSVW